MPISIKQKMIRFSYVPFYNQIDITLRHKKNRGERE